LFLHLESPSCAVKKDYIHRVVKSHVKERKWDLALELANSRQRPDLVQYIHFCQNIASNRNYLHELKSIMDETNSKTVQDCVEFTVLYLCEKHRFIEATEVYSSWVDIFRDENRRAITEILTEVFETNKITLQEAKEVEHLLDILLERMGLNESDISLDEIT
jgi:transcription elongation factor Elf1